MAFWLVSILFLGGISAQATTNSKWFTRVWQIDDGLLDNTVSSVVQGSDDYLWLATSIGVMRFDGDSFSQFPIEKFAGDAASHVRLMFCSSAGVLWMASDGGTVIGFKPDFSMILLPRTLPTHLPQALAEGGDGSLWLGYSDVVYQIQNGQPIAVNGLPSGPLHSLESDSTGNMWLAKGDQIGIFKDGRFCHVATVPGMRLMTVTYTNVWLTTWCHLFTCDVNGALRDCGPFQTRKIGTSVLFQDHAGGVWIGTGGNGLFRYDKSTFERIETSHPSILSLTEDREGNIWAGTSGGGLDRISLRGVWLETIEDSPSSSQIQSICQDSHGVLWSAARNGNLVFRTDNGWKPVFANSPFAGIVTCVAADRTAVWIGTWNGQLFRLANNNHTIWETNVARGKIVGLLPASNGELWIAGEHSLQCLHDQQLEEVKLPRQVQNLYAIAEDASGGIWIGANGIVVHFKGRKFANEIVRLYKSVRPICCLYGTTDGSLWIGSRGGGLLRFKDGRVSQIGVKQGLYDSYISQMIADGRGWMWFAANHGIFKVRQQELEQAMENRNVVLRPIIYGKNEELASQEAVSSVNEPLIFPRAMLGSDGRVWMLVHDGVVAGDPKILPESSPPPRVLITGMVVDDQTIASYGGVAETQMVANPQKLKTPLRLPPLHRHLEFDFTAIHFSDPENVHFRYQLVGFDNGWIDTGTQRSVDYTRLAAGDYEFRVEACIGDGPWSETPAMLALTVAPFFWQTWWFRFGALLLFTVSVIAGVRYVSFRRLQLKLRLMGQQAAVERERGRIARDIHDDLGNRLTKIQLLTGLAHKDRTTPDKALVRVREISSVARQATDALDEIVWAINPRNDTLPHLIDYLGQFAVEYLRTAGIRCRVDLPDRPPAKPVLAEIRHNLFLVLKESLNNIVRHANATEVFLAIRAEEESLGIIIEDNGCGFNGEVRANGADGLENMRARVNEIGGQFQIKSSPGAGVSISVRGPWLNEK